MTPFALLTIALVGGALPVRADPCVRDPLKSAEPRAFLGYDLGMGLTAGRGSLIPWSFSSRLYPTVSLDRSSGIRLAGLGGVALVNPELEGIFGSRLTFRAAELLPFGNVGAHVGVEGFYGTSSRWALGPTVVVDPGGLFTFTLRADWDFTNDAAALELAISIGRLWTLEAKDRVVLPPPTETDLAGQSRTNMRTAMNGALGVAREIGVAECRALVNTARAFLDGPGRTATTVQDFRAALIASGLADVNRRLFNAAPPPGPADEPVVLAAWREAMLGAIR